MEAVKTPDTEPIPGYRLLEPLGRGGYGEVWKCTAPGGLTKAIKFVAASDSISDVGCAATQELQALQHIKQIRHPFLLSIERVEIIDGELIVVMELADRSLNDLLHDCRQDGLSGIPRGELIGYLRDTAEALDLLNLEHGLQHLDVKPRNLFLVGRHVKVADFGLVNSLAEIHGGEGHQPQLCTATPVYASPESFAGRITLFSDQYSLAIAYCELLTGSPPFSGKNYRQLALQHTGMEPDLANLPAHDRRVVARALSKEPGNRFRSCLEFIEALEEAAPVVPHSSTGSRPVRILKPAAGFDLTVPNKPDATPAGHGGTPLVARLKDAAALVKSTESLSDYQFLECLGRMRVGESWRAVHKDGRPCLIKLVFGCPAADDANESGAIAKLAALNHSALARFTVVRDGPQRIALIVDEQDGTLLDRLNDCRTAGQAGVPRDELMKYLRRAADALDDLHLTSGLQHLTLNPRALVMDHGEVCVADFGLAQLIWVPAGLDAPILNLRYASPEFLAGRIEPGSDQYSLALIFLEAVTGLYAFRNLSPRQLALPLLRSEPDLELLSTFDRPIVARALHSNPEQRFASCSEFIAALTSAGARAANVPRSSPTVPKVKAPKVVQASAPLPPTLSREEGHGLVKKLLDESKGSATTRNLKGFRFRVIPDVLMEHHFTARFLHGALPIKLEGFRQHWLATEISSSEHEIVYHITPPTKGLQRLLGRQQTLKMLIFRGPPDETGEIGFAVSLEPLRRSERLLEELGPRIFDSIRQFLQAEPDRRREERFQLAKSLRVMPVFETNEIGEGIVAQALNISEGGIGFYLPCRPASTEVLLEVGVGPGLGSLLAAKIVRADQCPDGRYLIGVKFTEDNRAAE